MHTLSITTTQLDLSTPLQHCTPSSKQRLKMVFTSAAITATETAPCFLLKLPEELRKKIYRIVLDEDPYPLEFTISEIVGDEDSVLSDDTDQGCTTTDNTFKASCATEDSSVYSESDADESFEVPRQPELASVCKEIRLNVLPIFYGDRKVIIDRSSFSGSGSGAGWWLKTEAWKAAAVYVRNLQLHFEFKQHANHFTGRKGLGCHTAWKDRIGSVRMVEKAGRLTTKSKRGDRCDCEIREFAKKINAGLIDTGAKTKVATIVEWLEKSVLESLRYRYRASSVCQRCQKLAAEEEMNDSGSETGTETDGDEGDGED